MDCAVASDGRPWPFPSLQRSVHILPRQRQLRTCYKPALQGTCALQCQRRLRSIPVLRVGSARWHGPVTKGGASGTAPHGTALHPRKGPLATSSHLPAGVHTGDSGPGAFECPIQVSHDARLLLVVSFIISRHWQRVILRQSAHQLYLDPCTDSDDVRCYPRTRSIQRLSQWNSSLSLGRITDGTGSMVVGRAASS